MVSLGVSVLSSGPANMPVLWRQGRFLTEKLLIRAVHRCTSMFSKLENRSHNPALRWGTTVSAGKDAPESIIGYFSSP